MRQVILFESDLPFYQNSRNLHVPLCGIFFPNSVVGARYDTLNRTKSPTNHDVYLAESLF